jgi:hypothetical protein
MHQAMATVLGDVRFHELLLRFDRDLSAAVRARGCASCRAVLHSARYARKPRGAPEGLSEDYCQCLSLCCARDGCRQRANPPSLRFLSRKVYLCGVVVLICVLRLGPTPTRIAQLQELVGVSPRTVLRWRQWWRDIFTQSAFWCVVCADFMPPVETSELPASLLSRFAGDSRERLIALLRFLAPVTASASVRRAL